MVGGISRTGDPVAGQLRSPRLGSGKNKLADGSISAHWLAKVPSPWAML